mmetsp:Transcript_29247/g.70560  ORF Transcript_29247/g.70560 Transcript_29247/m.70560 type:complete len:80 (+) Transcript_29247:2159-2398(+)
MGRIRRYNMYILFLNITANIIAGTSASNAIVNMSSLAQVYHCREEIGQASSIVTYTWLFSSKSPPEGILLLAQLQYCSV